MCGNLHSKLDGKNYKKLSSISNKRVISFIAEAAELCNPADIFVCNDSPEDINYIRRMALDTGEEKPLAIEGHIYHFDGMYDRARDRKQTKFLVP